jgi:hypothetical protein
MGSTMGDASFDFDILLLSGTGGQVGQTVDRVVVEVGTHRVLVSDTQQLGDLADPIGQDPFRDALAQVDATSLTAGPELVGETAEDGVSRFRFHGYLRPLVVGGWLTLARLGAGSRRSGCSHRAERGHRVSGGSTL